MILLLDNYDSFVHNLARFFAKLGLATKVIRNDDMSVDEIEQMQPAAIVLSPGPCTPNEAGVCLEVVRRLFSRFPMLGICLGHQTIAAALGGNIVRAPTPVHGRTSEIHHNGAGIFAGVPEPLTVCRYHSLVTDTETLPEALAVTATTEDGIIMAIEHRKHPVIGLQFHPESILTDSGYLLLKNFLRRSDIEVEQSCESRVLELQQRIVPTKPLPSAPVTF